MLNSLVFFAGNPSYSNDVQNNEVLERSLQGSHRSEGNRLRDKYRRPVETLTFFGVKPNSNVVEITPGRGWYSEILAPLLKANGTFTAVIYDANLTDLGPYWDGLVNAEVPQMTATQRAMLEPYRQARMAKEGEIAPLLASSVIGTNVVPGDPTQGVWGVSAPLPDVNFLTSSELQYLEMQRLTFNGMIKMMLNTRPGVGNDKLEGREKYEGVYIFSNGAN